MRPFRFRASSALDLRKKQEDEARLALGRAQNAAAVADARLQAARDHAAGAGARLVALQEEGAPAWLIGWHRSWIVQQARVVEIRRLDMAMAAAAVTTAEAIVRDAFRQRRVLERLRDRLAARHARALERHELNQMNELAGLRYIAAAAERKEQQ
jgi:flagellar export protein FliJ